MCRSRREFSNAYLLAKFGFYTAENEPSKVCRIQTMETELHAARLALSITPGAVGRELFFPMGKTSREEKIWRRSKSKKTFRLGFPGTGDARIPVYRYTVFRIPVRKIPAKNTGITTSIYIQSLPVITEYIPVSSANSGKFVKICQI